MKILPVLLVLTAIPAFAQTPAAPAASPTPATRDSAQATSSRKPKIARATPPPRAAQPSATPLPVRRAVRVTPENEKRPGFFARIFGGKPRQGAAPAPSASPTATPKPVAATRKKAPSVSITPDSNEVTPTGSSTPPLPETASRAASTPPAPRVSKPSANVQVTPPAQNEAPESVTIPRGVTDPAPGEETPYQRVRREAARDPQIAALGEKLNAADPGDAYKAVAKEYATALFAKMREIDPAQTDWFNRMEGATIRRIDSGKPFVAE